MGSKKRPLEVVRAIQDGDEATLRVLGKAGGKKAGELSKQRADNRFVNEARRLEDAKAHAEANRIGWDDDFRP